MATRVPLTFLGTGNFFADAGYWNSVLVDGRLLLETSPTVLPQLRHAGADPNAIEVIFLSHFHADHTFGWPFLLLHYLTHGRRRADLWVVGPPGIAAQLEAMLQAGGVHHLIAMARAMTGGFGLHFVEVSEQAQAAGPVSFRAVRVEHDPALACYGYLLELAGRTIGYSGDTRLCAGLRELARRADLLVVECNHRHAGPESIAHLSLDDVRTLRAEYPQLPLVLTHRGAAVDAGGMADVWVPQDLETLQL